MTAVLPNLAETTTDRLCDMSARELVAGISDAELARGVMTRDSAEAIIGMVQDQERRGDPPDATVLLLKTCFAVHDMEYLGILCRHIPELSNYYLAQYRAYLTPDRVTFEELVQAEMVGDYICPGKSVVFTELWQLGGTDVEGFPGPVFDAVQTLMAMRPGYLADLVRLCPDGALGCELALIALRDSPYQTVTHEARALAAGYVATIEGELIKQRNQTAVASIV